MPLSTALDKLFLPYIHHGTSSIIIYLLETNNTNTSRGDAHPRAIGCRSDHKAFLTLDEAREYMNKKGVTLYDEVIKEGAGKTTPLRQCEAFYAVANGNKPGIYPYYK